MLQWRQGILFTSWQAERDEGASTPPEQRSRLAATFSLFKFQALL